MVFRRIHREDDRGKRRDEIIQRRINSWYDYVQDIESSPESGLSVSSPTDPSEKEARATADRITGSTSSSPGLSSGTGSKKASIHLRKDESGTLKASSDIRNRLKQSKGGGKQLPEEFRTRIESETGQDHSNVRVHTDKNAERMAHDLNAKAFTHEEDIYLSGENYDLESREGQNLIVEEVVHTGQERHDIQRKIDWNTNEYIIEPGDGAYLIAQKLGVNVHRLLKFNNLEIKITQEEGRTKETVHFIESGERYSFEIGNRLKLPPEVFNNYWWGTLDDEVFKDELEMIKESFFFLTGKFTIDEYDEALKNGPSSKEFADYVRLYQVVALGASPSSVNGKGMYNFETRMAMLGSLEKSSMINTSLPAEAINKAQVGHFLKGKAYETEIEYLHYILKNMGSSILQTHYSNLYKAALKEGEVGQAFTILVKTVQKVLSKDFPTVIPNGVYNVLTQQAVYLAQKHEQIVSSGLAEGGFDRYDRRIRALQKLNSWANNDSTDQTFEGISKTDIVTGLKARIKKPKLIDQYINNLCGPAAVAYIFCKDDPVGFVEVVTTLFEDGKVTYNNFTVEPRSYLFDKSPPSGMDAVDWMFLSSIRDDENWLVPYKGKHPSGWVEEASGITLPDEVNNWIREFLGWSDVYSNVWLTHGPQSYTAVDHIVWLENLRRNGYNVIMLINNSWSTDNIITFPEHWVILTELKSTSNGYVEFTYMDAGGTPHPKKVDYASFMMCYFGGIAAKAPGL